MRPEFLLACLEIHRRECSRGRTSETSGQIRSFVWPLILVSADPRQQTQNRRPDSFFRPAASNLLSALLIQTMSE